MSETVSHHPVRNAGNQFGHFLRWLNARAWPLTGILFALAYRYLWIYFADEKIPLNVLSPSIFSALPAFLLVLLSFLVVIFGLLFFQTYFLFTPVLASGSDVPPVFRLPR